MRSKLAKKAATLLAKKLATYKSESRAQKWVATAKWMTGNGDDRAGRTTYKNGT